MKTLVCLAAQSSHTEVEGNKTRIRFSPCLVSILLVGVKLMPANSASAQSFTLLHSFSITSAHDGTGTNADGAAPQASLVRSGNVLYGTSAGGGTGANGNIFALSINGDFTNLYSFTPTSSGSNIDGALPFAPLLLYNNFLFGTAHSGGNAGKGTVFKIGTNGTGFASLHDFTGGDDGYSPWSGLAIESNFLYGTTAGGGTFAQGVVFKMDLDGSSFSAIHSFQSTTGSSTGFPTNSEGSNPYGGLILADGVLYGTAAYGGSGGGGSVFAMAPDGSVFTNLHNFSYTRAPYTGTNADGANPFGSLVVVGRKLYGTAAYGGVYGYGTVFAINMDGTGFVNLHNFNNTDGAQPQAELTLLGGSLYGTTVSGGKFLAGTVFSLSLDGSGFTPIYDFPQCSGAALFSGLVSLGNNLYGTASAGGVSGNGTLFRIALQPQLTLMSSGQSLVLSWPTNFSGYTLQSTTSLNSPVWTTNLPAPVVVNSQYTVTNPISGTQQFFRLTQ